MSKWKVIAPLGVLAAGAAAAAVLLKKKDGGSAPKAAAPAAKKAAETEKLMKTGEYSFVSGFKDARTVEVRLDYDALRFGFDVIGEDFLTYSSDSHVAVVSGERAIARIPVVACETVPAKSLGIRRILQRWIAEI